MPKLAILSTHPIQYNAPLFRLLAQDARLKVKVFYTLGQESSGFTDPGFGKAITWDIPLLEGYDYMFVPNTASKPSTGSFRGIINPTLIQELEVFGATHLLVYGWAFQSHLKAIRYFKDKVKILFRGDSTLLDEKPGVKTIMRRVWLQWVYKHVDAALYVGSNNKAYYLKHGIPPEKLVFAPHAIDNDRFSKDEHKQKALELKQQLGIDEAKKVFLFAGKFEWKKNPLILVKAFLNLKQKGVVLVMVGNGALEEEIKRITEGNEQIKFLPFQNQTLMPAVYRLGDVLVLPSVTETWGLSMNEAMACGIAVVASIKVGGAKDLIEEGRNGYIFKSGDVDQLTDALYKLAEMPHAAVKEMGVNSQVKIKEWSYERTVSAILNCVLK